MCSPEIENAFSKKSDALAYVQEIAFAFVAAARHLSGFNISTFAREANVNRRIIERLEHKTQKSGVDLRTLVKIAKAAGKSLVLRCGEQAFVVTDDGVTAAKDLLAHAKDKTTLELKAFAVRATISITAARGTEWGCRLKAPRLSTLVLIAAAAGERLTISLGD